ncbi:hypothetical protein [Gimesia chilikensis]|uniref:hypothetical protein n=1 Tax=Gimesia chilikensis TaxID=2605989 RepID=UPI00118BD7A0|nr:hypothetical protein [Gimesia chilikensis]QDT87310.1 hypothetical protein MalM14_49950 [Gimesia chilikensis]
MADETTVTLTAATQTNGTTADGARDSNTSPWDSITVSENEVFRENTITKAVVASRGDTEDTVEFDDYIEILPGTGITQPRTLRIKVWARSPKVPPLSNIGVKGVREIEVKCTAVKFR